MSFLFGKKDNDVTSSSSEATSSTLPLHQQSSSSSLLQQQSSSSSLLPHHHHDHHHHHHAQQAAGGLATVAGATGLHSSGSSLTHTHTTGSSIMSSAMTGVVVGETAEHMQSFVEAGVAVMTEVPVAAVMQREVVQPVTTYTPLTEYVTREVEEAVVREEAVTHKEYEVTWVEKEIEVPEVRMVKQKYMEPVLREETITITVPRVEMVTRVESIPVTGYRPETTYIKKNAGTFTQKVEQGVTHALNKLELGADKLLHHHSSTSNLQPGDLSSSSSASSLASSLHPSTKTDLNSQSTIASAQPTLV